MARWLVVTQCIEIEPKVQLVRDWLVMTRGPSHVAWS
jgi:hypothetical protein